MKTYIYLILAVLLTLTACNTQNNKQRVILTNIIGELNDVLVVMEDVNWEQNGGKNLKDILQEDYYALPQYEPMFKVIQINHSEFTNDFQLYRNIIDVKLSNTINTSKIWYGNDVFSRPQAYLKIEAKNSIELVKLLENNSQKIQAFFKTAELNRLQKSYKNHFSIDIMNHLKKKYNIRVEIPANYKLETDSNHFSWVSFETPEMSQGIFIYSYNYNDTSQFSLSNLIKTRNSFLKLFVPGPSKGSYMTTEPEFPVRKTEQLDSTGLYTVFLEGLWRTHGDFMGGPFVSYSFADKENEQIICLDAYVYCPKKDKRKFMMQLEAIIKTVRYN